MQYLSRVLRRAFQKERRKERKDGSSSCLFSYNNCWLIPFISGERSFNSENFKSTFANFFCILLKANDVLCDRRMTKSQKTTCAMTPVLYGRGSFQFSLVFTITRTCAEECAFGLLVLVLGISAIIHQTACSHAATISEIHQLLFSFTVGKSSVG